MAKITVTIEAENARDLRDSIWDLANQYDGENAELDHKEMTNEEARMYGEPDAGSTQDAEPGERQRRTRRTKAQIAEDNARAAAGGSTAEAAKPALDAGAQATTQRSGSATDPFGDQIKEVTKTGGVTADQVKELGRTVFAKIGSAATQALLMEHANGAKAFNDPLLTPDHYDAVYAALEAAGA